MISQNTILNILKPAIPKRYLLFVAAFVWTFAGGMLLFRGFSVIYPNISDRFWEVVACLACGILFYLFMFSKISAKHVKRILNIQIEKPCLFSFFNVRSYIMMASMITLGITLRKTGLVPLEYLSYLYITMGIPLSLSAIRFYYNGINYSKSLEKLQ